VIINASDPLSIDRAVRALAAGRAVVLPTETVYGLAADATNGEAVAGIFALKGRPQFNPLICHVDSVAMARQLADCDQRAETLMANFWPGPLTLVLPRSAHCPVHPLATAGLDTIAIRQPAGVAAQVIAALGKPLAAPSANISGRLSTTRAGDVAAQFSGHGLLADDDLLIVDAGPCPVGVESTIVSLVGETPVLLRPGGIGADELAAALGTPVETASKDAAVTAPGMLASHYAPRAPLRLDVAEIRPGEACLAFGSDPLPGAEHAIASANLSPAGDLRQAAAALFAALADLDAHKPVAIAVAPIPRQGLGVAINDRLARAAAPRPASSSDISSDNAGQNDT